MNDKLLHALVGALIAFALLPFGFWPATGGVLIAAVGKELYDLRHRDRHTPELADAEATVLGGATALAWAYVVSPQLTQLLGALL